MDSSAFDGIVPEFSNGRVYAGGFSKPCCNCGKDFTARSERDRFCYECSHDSTHPGRDLIRRTSPYRLYSGLGAFQGSDYVYYHAQLGSDYLHTDHDIQWYEWLRWASSLRQAKTIDVVDSGKYHWARIFMGLPRDRGMKMFDDEYGYGKGTRAIPFPYPIDTDTSESPDGQRWLIRLFYNERVLEFQPKPCDCSGGECAHSKKQWSRIQDMSHFTDRPISDLIAIDVSLGTAGQRRIITAGDEYVNRNARMPEDMAYEYCLARHDIAVQIMERKREAFSRAGIRLMRNKEYGIGCAAGQAMINHGIATRKRRGTSVELIRAGLASYYGPWMEDVACGFAGGSAYEYDLNSAFGAILAGMPCMVHGWTHGTGQPGKLKRGHLRLEHAYLRGPGTMPFGPALYREKNGHVISPVESAGWHWTHELAEREKNGLIEEWVTDEWWDKAPCDQGCPKPFAWVSDLYDLRISYGRKTLEGILFGKLQDAVYGKLAESGEYATFTNYLYASYVTATDRAMVLKGIRTHQDGIRGVLKVMSDSFVMRNPHNRPGRLPVGKGLGEWKPKTHTNVTVFAPNGIWWSDETEKTSGIKPGDMPILRDAADAVFRSWDKTEPGIMNEFPEIKLQIGTRFTTLTQAARTSWANAGRVETGTVEIRRYEPQRYRDAEQIYYDPEFGFFRSYPKDKGESGLESAPYSRHKDWKDDDDMLGFNQHGPILAKTRKALGQ